MRRADGAEKARKLLGRIIKSGRAGIKSASLEVFFLENGEMKKLKRRFFPGNKSEFVDVLSFREPMGFPHPEAEGRFLGEIFLNERLKKDDPARLVLSAIHGFLHLLGYDHSGKNDTIRMRNMEKKLIRRFVDN